MDLSDDENDSLLMQGVTPDPFDIDSMNYDAPTPADNEPVLRDEEESFDMNSEEGNDEVEDDEGEEDTSDTESSDEGDGRARKRTRDGAAITPPVDPGTPIKGKALVARTSWYSPLQVTGSKRE
jgi:hypothetical protein